MIFVKSDQHCVKKKFVKIRVGEVEFNLNLDNVCKYTGGVLTLPLTQWSWEGGWSRVELGKKFRLLPKRGNGLLSIFYVTS